MSTSKKRTFREWWFRRGRFIASHVFLIGVAANQSMATGEPVDVQRLLVED